MSTAAVLLALALWIGPGPSVVRARAGLPTRGRRVRPRICCGADHHSVVRMLNSPGKIDGLKRPIPRVGGIAMALGIFVPLYQMMGNLNETP